MCLIPTPCSSKGLWLRLHCAYLDDLYQTATSPWVVGQACAEPAKLRWRNPHGGLRWSKDRDWYVSYTFIHIQSYSIIFKYYVERTAGKTFKTAEASNHTRSQSLAAQIFLHRKRSINVSNVRLKIDWSRSQKRPNILESPFFPLRSISLSMLCSMISMISMVMAANIVQPGNMFVYVCLVSRDQNVWYRLIP